MIHYQLQCGAAHGFDGWFKDSASFDKQAKRGLLECPVCGDAQVERALMAPAVPKKGRAMRNSIVETPPAPVAPPMAVQAEAVPAQMRAMLQKLRAAVESNCDYVGDDFADEARAMHNGESAHRGIYGEATEADADSLAEEGISISQIPWVPRADG